MHYADPRPYPLTYLDDYVPGLLSYLLVSKNSNKKSGVRNKGSRVINLNLKKLLSKMTETECL